MPTDKIKKEKDLSPESQKQTLIDAVHSKIKKRTEEGLNAGLTGEQLSQMLEKTITGGSGQQQQQNAMDTLRQILSLAQLQVPGEEREGLLSGLIRGHGLSRQQISEPLGFQEAQDLYGVLQKEKEFEAGAPKRGIDLLSQVVDYAKKTGNRELLGVLTQGSKEELQRELPGVKISEIGSTGPGTGITEEGYFEIDPLTNDLTPQALKRRKEIEVRTTKETEILSKQGADLSEKKSNFGRVISTLERAMSQLKGGIQEDAAGSLMKGLSGDLRIFFKRPGVGRAASYDAQINETSLAMNNILTGQNRVIKGVINMIKSTFPSRKAPEDMIAGLMAQTIENAYGIFKAFEKAGLNPEELRLMTQQQLNDINVQDLVGRLQLTPEELQEQETFVQRVLNAAPAQRRGLNLGVSSKEIEAIDEELIEINRQLGVQ